MSERVKTDDWISKTFHDMHANGIKEPGLFLISKKQNDFTWMRGAFPRNILPTDIDGLVEIDGKFLLIEFKHEDVLNNTDRIHKGQLNCFRRLHSQLKSLVVLFVGCNHFGDPSRFCFLKKDGEFSEVKPTTKAELFLKLKAWGNS